MEKIILQNRLTLLLVLIAVQIFLSSGSVVLADSHTGPDAIIKLPENETAILIEKKTQTMFVYSSVDNEISVLFQSPCSTGEVFGIKEKVRDKKTPEGIYFLNDEYEDKYLSPIYGEKAFPTDYPNFLDKKAGKNGSSIWIHGTNKKLKPMDSNGCIALENSNIIKLSDYVTLNSTPVIIAEQIDEIDSATLKQQEKTISAMLLQWLSALEKGSYHDYLSFYSSIYLPDISWWEQWIEIRELADRLDSSLSVAVDKAGMYYHNHVVVVVFDCFIENRNKKILLGKRKLFLKNKDNTFKIIGDTFQYIQKEFQSKKVPIMAAAHLLVKSAPKKETVVETINHWLAAWSAKDMAKYAGFYAANFYSDGLNKKRWVQRKKAIAQKYNFINVSGKDFNVTYKNDRCEVVFSQAYESSGLTTDGTKKLKLVNTDGLWKIYQESWKKK